MDQLSIINLTPHTINITTADGGTVIIPPEPGPAPRLTLTEATRTAADLAGGPVTVISGRTPTGVAPDLPAPTNEGCTP